MRLVVVIAAASLVHLIKAARFPGKHPATSFEQGQTVIVEPVVVDYIMTVGPISLGFSAAYLLAGTSRRRAQIGSS